MAIQATVKYSVATVTLVKEILYQVNQSNQSHQSNHQSRFPLRSHSDLNTEHVKIYFSLIKDETGYPPADTESLWAIPLGDNKFCIDSIPFFVVGISYLDIVSGQKTSENILYFENILQRSGHSTIRVILYEDIPGETSVSIRMKELRSMLREIGCSTELSHIPSLVSVDIPPEVPIQKVKEILDGGEQTELWEYEEAALAHTPEAS